ncbi:putative uroporphyrinogen-III C-methyltransferase [Neolecta irregularis DAH-3]|uniref:uroporphyrinogen-III C-methyltransferase n=1 Tax=Neolecta irregularis (strain DAH-3) TaxID=1198029 RepID=A0A1U7LP60_NEOID|nr:putative uroporphyrinogen-III C-methyltransferase [Neolecta irregularis DAH-3]|eukprot:OLL24434.1 putative uroporphyrinogen-III C-methyltransferase [Neolecta irregularis DAH-3]
MSQKQFTPSLLISRPSVGHHHLIVGPNNLAISRCMKSIEVGALPILISPFTPENMIAGVKFIQKDFEECDLVTWGTEKNSGYVDLVFFTGDHTSQLAQDISSACHRHRIPINVVDSPSLSSFTLLSSHHDGPLQFGISTSRIGRPLANRIKSEIVSRIPPRLGNACSLLAYFREHLTAEEKRSRLNHISEFWPLNKICSLTVYDIEGLLQDYTLLPLSKQATRVENPGRISLVGSGPGDPKLLTVAALEAINSADVVLADKLVPSSILDLVPRRSTVHIARKFPGNTANAQQELLVLGLTAVKEGKNVIRLKQGDPYIFGRGGEEMSFFEDNGFKPIVIPGITSALSAGIFSVIPLTIRGAADQVLIATGTGENGSVPQAPEYIISRTTVFLMALHRLEILVANLITNGWPQDLACAVVERASCRDQRIVRTRLQDVVGAMKVLGNRPPGLLIVGRACEVLRKCQAKWVVEEGFDGFPIVDSPYETDDENYRNSEFIEEEKQPSQLLQTTGAVVV